jgi:hypothetical protein
MSRMGKRSLVNVHIPPGLTPIAAAASGELWADSMPSLSLLGSGNRMAVAQIGREGARGPTA